jgi:cytochrome c554/c'-like protein
MKQREPAGERMAITQLRPLTSRLYTSTAFPVLSGRVPAMFNTDLNSAAKPSIRSARSCFVVMALVVACWLSTSVVVGQAQTAGESSATTRDRLSEPHWWPTKSTPDLEAYASDNACNVCHSTKASSQLNTPMAKAALRLKGPIQSPNLAPESTQLGTYLYRISSDRGSSALTVGTGTRSISASIRWIFGVGVHGQTYILEKNDALYESQVSSFVGLQKMDLTPGHTQVEADNIVNALGERLTTSLAARCFACHTTHSSTSAKFDASHAAPGVHCEACHGPGRHHIDAMQGDKTDEALQAIFNPASLSPLESVDFCGACHRTSVDVVVSEEAYGPINVRFQPYRLEKSRCWGTQGDARLTCVACHDPHEPVVRTASFYDERCLNCHAARENKPSGHDSAPAMCPVATANCTGCHMPKSEVPEMHAKFTDHFIRVVRTGESYPN